ncbi:MAG: 50S ribosomal protein L32 [Candidatus Pacebacteria bacterium]|nr:50S ribosomal protein L32 [Candidatus Paceibacterota bacterium]
MRHTSGHTGNRRSHHALKEPRLSTCPDCKAPTKRHTVCNACGRYRGRVVIDMAAKLEKKHAKEKAKNKDRTEEATEEPEVVEDKPLDAAELSKK